LSPCGGENQSAVASCQLPFVGCQLSAAWPLSLGQNMAAIKWEGETNVENVENVENVG
jgi:hypothetical protein